MKKAFKSYKKGFALLEIVVVLVLITVVTYTISFTIKSYERHSIINEANNIKHFLFETKMFSINNNVNCSVDINISSNSLKSYKLLNNINSYYLNKNVNLYSTTLKNNKITFTSLGTTNEACTIVLLTKHYSIQITTNVGNGKVTISNVTKR